MIDTLIANLSWPKNYNNHKLIQKDSGFGGEQILVGLRQQPALQRSLCNRKREPSEQENGSQRPWTQNDLLQTVEIIILIIWITARLRARETILACRLEGSTGPSFNKNFGHLLELWSR